MPGQSVPRGVGEWPNPIASRLRRLPNVGAVLATLLGVGAILYFAADGPRLLTWAEIVPPDETLVAGLLPALTVAVVCAVLWMRYRFVPVSVAWAEGGVRFLGGRSSTSPVVPWSRIEVEERADPVEGVAVWVGKVGTGRHRLFVDAELANRLRAYQKTLMDAGVGPGSPPGPR